MNHVDRRLPSMDCEVLGTCRASWCCGICNHCRRKRRNLRKLAGNPDAPGQVAKAADEPGDVVVRTNGQADTKAEQRAIEKFEKRVGRMIEKRLRRLARQGGAPCLGNFWELEVEFVRHFFEYV